MDADARGGCEAVTMETLLSRGTCAYCGSPVLPNSSHCLECGQIVTTARPTRAPSTPAWAPPAVVRPAAAAPARRSPEFAVPRTPPAVAAEPPLRRRESAPRPAAAIPSAGLSDDRAGLLTLVFSTGEQARVGGSAVIGRNPRDAARNSGRQPVEVADPTRSMSRAHALIDLTPEGAFASDAGSGNGTVLERGGRRVQLDDTPQPLRDGDRLWLGDVSADVRLSGTGAY
jgi:hypothetical protein